MDSQDYKDLAERVERLKAMIIDVQEEIAQTIAIMNAMSELEDDEPSNG